MKKRVLCMIAVMAACVALSTLAWADTYEWTPQDKLMAKRAARVDAVRQLAEMIKGLQITSDTYVRDFVTESDIIQTELDTFLKGVKEGRVRYYDDGSCEVTMEVTVERVVRELKRIRDGYYKKGKFKGTVFEDLRTYTKHETVSATGSGVAPGAAFGPGEDVEDEGPDYGWSAPGHTPRSWDAIPPQARLMAERGAKVDAYRNLAETVKGLQITSDTYVRDFVTESDEIEATLDAFLKGVRIDQVRYQPDFTVEARATVTIERMVQELTRIRDGYYKKGKFKGTDFTTIRTYTQKKDVSAIGAAAVPAKYLPKKAEMEVDEDWPIEDERPATTPHWATLRIREDGVGVAPEDAPNTAQARLMALRAAKVDALRNLAEKIEGLKITSETTVSDLAFESDEITTELDAFIQGAEVVHQEFYEDGSALVTVELDGKSLYDTLMAME